MYIIHSIIVEKSVLFLSFFISFFFVNKFIFFINSFSMHQRNIYIYICQSKIAFHQNFLCHHCLTRCNVKYIYIHKFIALNYERKTPKCLLSNHCCHGYQAVVSLVLLASSSSSSSSSSSCAFLLIDKTDLVALDRADGLK